MAHLSASDYRGMLEFLYLAGENESPEPFPDQLLEHLRGLVACETVSYGGYDPNRRGWRRTPRWVGEPQAITASIREAHQALRHQYPHTPSDPAPVLRWSDRFSRRTWRRFALYCEVGRPSGVEHNLTIFLRDDAQVFGSFAFDRFDDDFTDRDVDVLEALTPHLLQLARNAEARWPGSATELTPREREVLAWVARGKTNQQIAATLYITLRTVGKHLENIYAKLDVTNRTSAVRRAYGPPTEGRSPEQASSGERHLVPLRETGGDPRG